MSHLRLSHKRTLFLAGKLAKKRRARPCHSDTHVGPLLDTERFDAAGGIWVGMGNCGTCGSTITRDQIRTVAA